MAKEKGGSGKDFAKGTIELCDGVVVTNFLSVDAKLKLEKVFGKTLDQIDLRSWTNLMPICVELAKQVNPEVDVKEVEAAILKGDSIQIEKILLDIFKVDLKNLIGPVTE